MLVRAGEIARVLAARDHFSVLGLSADDEALTDDAVRSAYRKAQLRVHPDKAGDAAGAEQASKRVNEVGALGFFVWSRRHVRMVV